MSANTVKERHYWRQLREALTAGKWDAQFPAKAPNGKLLSWSELLRKFNKHCPGHIDVAELASQTQALSLLLSANESDRSLDGNDVPQDAPLVLGQECMLPEERIGEGTAGYNALGTLESSNADSIKLAVAYYEYALRRPAECLATLSKVKALTDVKSRAAAAAGPARSSIATATLRDGPSDGSVSSAWTGSVASVLSSASVADISDGSTWAMTESIRSICLQGMCHEAMSAENPQAAFNAYTVALPSISFAISEIPPSLSQEETLTPFGMGDSNSFMKYRELWRWVERLLRRAIILGSRLFDVSRPGRDGGLWIIFEQYHSCSAHWPPTFRPRFRSSVAVLHLRAFVLRYRHSPHDRATLASDQPHRWVSNARSVVHEYRAILSVSTTFPRAGQRNVKVEDLTDLCVAIWEADGAVGEYAGWVIDVLWWATRYTFNSYRVFRHMSRLLYVSGDPELAKRTLRLYVQVVSKVRETNIGQEERDDSPVASVVGGDIDTDEHWVQTLVHGARMLCRLALTQDIRSKALEDAKEAHSMIEQAKTRLNANDAALVGSVKLAEGIWNAVMANVERNPDTRPSYFEKSLGLLLESLESRPTPAVRYHLALAYARPGPVQDLQTAITHARAAVEESADEIRYWHLLGLLLTATGDWKAAKVVLEVGAGVGEVDIADDATAAEDRDITAGQAALAADGVRTRDYVSAAQQNGTANGNGQVNGSMVNGDGDEKGSDEDYEPLLVLPPDATLIPPSAELLESHPDHPGSSRQELFEQALQLRMTQLTLAEFVEGPEGAENRWVEVFHWFSERREVGSDDRRMSIDSRRVSAEYKAPSEMMPSEKLAQQAESKAVPVARMSLDLTDASRARSPELPIPITITPSSPTIASPVRSSESGNPSLPQVLEDGEEKARNSNDMSRGKKVRQVLKSRVTKGQQRITTISRKIGHNVGQVGRHSTIHLKRSRSTSDLHAVLDQTPYQASSIHLRQHLSIYASQQDLSLLQPPPPPPPPPEPAQITAPSTSYKHNVRAARERRLLSNLWLMSAATFRRLGKIEQARGAIQEAEVKDDHNPEVWVQLGLYHMALEHQTLAMEAFRKALFIAPDDISATVHLCRLCLPLVHPTAAKQDASSTDLDSVDLSVGLLSDLTQGVAWDVPEAWYFLAKHYGLQGRTGLERECLKFALTLSENRPLRDIGVAVGWCL